MHCLIVTSATKLQLKSVNFKEHVLCFIATVCYYYFPPTVVFYAIVSLYVKIV